MVLRHIPVGQGHGGEEREELESARHQLCLSSTTTSEVSCGPAASIPTHGIIKSLHPLPKTARKGVKGKIHPVKELTLLPSPLEVVFFINLQAQIPRALRHFQVNSVHSASQKLTKKGKST